MIFFGKHLHEWGKWQDVLDVDDKMQMDTRIGARPVIRQIRVCEECGKKELSRV